jgi:beta-lactamase superfamily II metal-dependent hydrolase
LYLGNGQVSWLGTGDADLKTKKRRKPFLTHFGKLADNVATLTIPHHGSENNFDKDIIEKINPDLAVVAAAPYSKWRHPGTKVVQAIATQGIPLAVVTHGKHSKLIECVRFR